MDEKNDPVFEENGVFTEDGSIPFGGGADNAYIKEYAASPQTERTIEDIEKEELLVAEKQAEIRQRNERRREEAENKKPKGFSLPEKREEPKIKKPAEEPERESASAPTHPAAASPVKKLTRADLVMPLSDDYEGGAGYITPPVSEKKPARSNYITPLSDETQNKDRLNKTTGEEKNQLSKFEKIFSNSKGFSVLSLITGVSLIIWNVLYIITAVMRDNLFTKAVNTMLAQGQISFTAEFSSPALTVLKAIAYILPVLIIAWIISFRGADKKNTLYNKKTIIVIMCLIVLAAVMAVFDISYAHLVMV